MNLLAIIRPLVVAVAVTGSVPIDQTLSGRPRLTESGEDTVMRETAVAAPKVLPFLAICHWNG